MPKDNECKHENQSGRFCNSCGAEVQSEDDRSRSYFKDLMNEVLEERGLGKKPAKAPAPKKSVLDRALGK